MKILLKNLLLLVMITSCKGNNADNDSLQNNLNANNNLLCIEIDYEGPYPREGKLILYNIDANNKFVVGDNYSEENSYAYLSPDRICVGPGKISNNFIFKIIDLHGKIIQKFDITRKLNPHNFLYSIQDLKFINDSVFIFGYAEGIFSYNIKKDEIEKIVEIPNKIVREISFNAHSNMIAFTYQIGLDSLKQNKFAIYDINNHKLEFYDQSSIYLGNWSTDMKRIIFSDNSSKLIIYDQSNNTFTSFDDNLGTEKTVFPQAFFVNDHELLINGSTSWGIESNILYLYDLKRKSLSKKLHDKKTWLVSMSFSSAVMYQSMPEL